MKDILDLQKKYNVGFISIGDENFGSYKKETLELVKKLGLSLIHISEPTRR